MAATNLIARYGLYEEVAAEVEQDFLHIETIPVRSGRHDWRIRPHSHPRHSQLLLVTKGGGQMRIDERDRVLQPPCLMVVPAGVVHEIRFEPGTDGFVVTIATPCLDIACRDEPRMADAAGTPEVYGLDATLSETAEMDNAFALLLREFEWPAPGRRVMVIAHLQRILVALLRLHGGGRTEGFSKERDIVLRYRALLEEHFRTEKRLGFYAGKLAVTPARLNACCQDVAGVTSSHMLHERLIVEARRHLVYTGQSVTEVAHSIGFEDPAYFNRFFTRHTGTTPGAFRQQAAQRVIE